MRNDLPTENTTRECQAGAPLTPLGEARCSILTTHHKHFHPAWVQRTILLPGWYEEFERANASHWQSAKWAYRLFRESRNYDAVVTGAEHCGTWFAMLQTLFRRPSMRRPHVMIDFPWAARPGRLKLALKALQMRVTAPALDVIFAHSSPEEAARFTSALGVREGLFQFVPFHHSFTGPLPEVTEGDYIFSGGNYGRDYQTLIEALTGTNHKAIICAQEQQFLREVCVPPNVTVTAVTHQRFYEVMAGAAAVVVPLKAGDIHPGGHTIVVHAMALGKPVIVAAPPEYRSYIENGRTGLITTPGDAAQLRSAIDCVRSDRELTRTLAQNAKTASARFAPEEFITQVLRHVDIALDAKRNATASARGLHP
ncbi:MAG TPA: glycosyltransferase [Terriglobales bacterium]